MSIAPEIARLKACGVVPVVVIDEAEIAVPLAEALLAGGIDVIEITLRRPAAKESVAARGAVQGDVTDDDVVLRSERRTLGGVDRDSPAGETLADVIIGIPF